MRKTKNWILGISILVNIILGLMLFWINLNTPTYEFGRLEQEVEVGVFMSDSTLLKLPRGLTVSNVSERGLAAVGQFENERFSIVITSDDPNLVNYDLPDDSLQQFGNYYSAEVNKWKD
jgi:hypothetical protein